MGRAAYRRAEREQKKDLVRSKHRDSLYHAGEDNLYLSPYQVYTQKNKIYDEGWEYAVRNFCPMLFMLFAIEMKKHRIGPMRIFDIMHDVNKRVAEVGQDLRNEPELTNEGVRERLHKELEEMTGIDYQMK